MVHHKGHFTFKCPISSGQQPTQACFDANRLKFISGHGANFDPNYPDRAYIPPAPPGTQDPNTDAGVLTVMCGIINTGSSFPQGLVAIEYCFNGITSLQTRVFLPGLIGTTFHQAGILATLELVSISPLMAKIFLCLDGNCPSSSGTVLK